MQKSMSLAQCAAELRSALGSSNPPRHLQHAIAVYDELVAEINGDPQEYRESIACAELDFDMLCTRMVRLICSGSDPVSLFVRADRSGSYRNIANGRVYRLDSHAFSDSDATTEFWKQNLFIWGRPHRFVPKKAEHEMRLVKFPSAIGDTAQLQNYWGMAAYVQETIGYRPEDEKLCRRMYIPKEIGGRGLLHFTQYDGEQSLAEMLVQSAVEHTLRIGNARAFGEWGEEFSEMFSRNQLHIQATNAIDLGEQHRWDQQRLTEFYRQRFAGAKSHLELIPELLILPIVSSECLLEANLSPRTLSRFPVYRGLCYDVEEFQRLYQRQEELRIAQERRRQMLRQVNGGDKQVFTSVEAANSWLAELNNLLASECLQIESAECFLPQIAEARIGELVDQGLHIWFSTDGQARYDESQMHRQTTTAIAMKLADGPPPRWNCDERRTSFNDQRAQRVWKKKVGEMFAELFVYQSGGSLNLALRIAS